MLPEGWVDFTRTQTPASNADEYGAGFWVTPETGPGRARGITSELGPRDSFAAEGSEGQVILIVPSRDLVVVRLALMANSEESWKTLHDRMQEIAAAFPEVPG